MEGLRASPTLRLSFKMTRRRLSIWKIVDNQRDRALANCSGWCCGICDLWTSDLIQGRLGHCVDGRVSRWFETCRRYEATSR